MEGVTVTFEGVRGSTPCDGPDLARYGGSTSCVVVEAAGHDPILFDLGTGLRNYGMELTAAGRMQGFRGSALLSHLHWDHVQGVPFFVPLHCEDTLLDVYGPRQSDGPLAEVFEGMMRPPYFPIRPEQLEGTVAFRDVGDDDFPLGDAKVRSRWIRHVGPTLGYRLDWQGVSIAYLSDHSQGSNDGSGDDYVPDDVLDLCDGVDLLIHDAQHTINEFEAKRHWGHCTNEYALHVAKQSGAQRLVLFHHDPIHTDDALDLIAAVSRDRGAQLGIGEVIAAAEGMQLRLAPPHAPSAQ
jgi:phosphoribosyl 1,2-cyclic phosphodiesterase